MFSAKFTNEVAAGSTRLFLRRAERYVQRGEQMKSMLICPVCGSSLERCEHTYRCPSGHSFDIAAKGYVNLLLSNQMKSKLPGDNKLMVNARTEFLDKGYYSHLAAEAARIAKKYGSGGVILDAGCGEGYYTEKLYRAAAPARLVGADISKFACAKAAARLREENVEIAAASVFHLPMASASADMAVTMFAPFCREEFYRVLREGGCLLMVIPSEGHLMSLKRAVYDKPYENNLADTDIEGFELAERLRVQRDITLDNSHDIQSLFAMTPYYYKTSEEGHRRAEGLTHLVTSADFTLLVYIKK